MDKTKNNENRKEIKLCIISMVLPVLAAALTVLLFETDDAVPDDWFSSGFRRYFYAFLGGDVSMGAAIGTILSAIAFVRLLRKKSRAWILYLWCCLAPVIMVLSYMFGDYYNRMLP